MNRAGVLIDLSHVGDRTSIDAAEASASPVAITHSNPDWFVSSPRNKPDAVIEAVTSRGGVIGACLYPNVVGGAHAQLSDFCQMVYRLAEQVGIGHVGLGSDCTRNWGDEFVEWLRSGRWRPPSQETATWPAWPHWFTGPEDFPRLTEGLLAVGFTETEALGVLGENWLRLFDEVFPEGGSRDGGIVHDRTREPA